MIESPRPRRCWRVPPRGAEETVRLSAERPTREVVGHHVAGANDGGHASPGEPVAILEKGDDAECRGRLSYETGVLEEQPHARLDALLLDGSRRE
jgi:hypothetical protein